jgi:uncharacterized iron-regulated membrane protein
MKKLLKKWHLYLALAAGIFIMLQSISGALLTFGKEIQRAVSPASWMVTVQQKAASPQQLISLLQMQAKLENVKVESLYLEAATNLAWQAKLSNGEQWNLNPYSGEIVDRFKIGSDFYSFTLHFHRWLQFNEEPNRGWARHLISVAASILIIQILLGLVMWLKPRKHALKRLKFKIHKTVTANLLQWHLIAGVYTAPLLILIACCGIGFNWPAIGKLVEWSTASNIEKPAQHDPVKVGGLDSWQLALQNGQAALPTGQLHRIYFPKGPAEPLTLRYQLPEEIHPFSYVWLDGGSGEILAAYDASGATLATRVWNFKYKLHIGDFAGMTVRIVWLWLSLLPAFFVVSGVWLWWRRHSLAVRH